MIEVVLLGLLAGAITTVAGMGGGLVLTLGLAVVHGPLVALASTGPGLLVGNIHRGWLYRTHVQRGTATRFVLGAAPTALVGGMVATAVPSGILQIGLILLAGVAAAKVLLGWSWTAPAGAVTPLGAAAGFVTATSGGGGLIAGPTLLATGLSGRDYVATGAVGAVGVHVGRMLGYGAGGLFEAQIVLLGLCAAIAIPLGNLLGEQLRRRIPGRLIPKLEIGVVLLALGLALFGLS